jgi:hypothetical protein
MNFSSIPKHHYEGYGVRKDSRILNYGSRWCWVFNITLLVFIFMPSLQMKTRSTNANGMLKYRLYDYTPSALPPVPIGCEAEWTPEPVWTQRESPTPVKNPSLVVQPLANPFTGWAVRNLKLFLCFYLMKQLHGVDYAWCRLYRVIQYCLS